MYVQVQHYCYTLFYRYMPIRTSKFCTMLIKKVIKIHPQTCKKCITLITCHPVNILNRMQISILKGKIFDSQPLSYIRLEQQSEFPPFKEHKIQGLFQDFQGPSYAYLRTEMCQLLQHLSPLPARRR